MKPLFMLFGALAATFSIATQAQDPAASYPSRPVRVIVPFPAGGASDIVARLVAERAAAATGQPWVVDNKPGAGATIGGVMVAKAAPDGYTLLLGAAGPLSMSPHISTVPYDVEKQFVALASVASVPNLVAVHPSLPAANLSQLVALARSKPGQLNYGSAGNGTTAHMAGELLKSQAGVDITHIPYKGTSAAVVDLVAGQIQMTIDNLPALLPYVQSGQLRALAVTSPTRSAAAPSVPTSAEAGMPDFVVRGWFGFFAPAGTPQGVVDKLSAMLVRMAGEPQMQEALRKVGAEPDIRDSAQFAAYVRQENLRWKAVADKAGLRVD
ncbi:tripartite tricarboxylate transporter substrate binding protein [Pigmentiphaga soli]|uniref:Tripartite tricarboxylate transporter substrate binding protein n=1 Tax=Pigmentiphaga soli TaxID=1007095 RepID=A0ABP8H7J2_9BURK